MSSHLLPTCRICDRALDDDAYCICIQQHVTCIRCGSSREQQQGRPIKISASECRVCIRKIIDPTGEIRGFPPKLEKAFLLQKLISGVLSICEVGAHSVKCTAKFYCSDCNTYCCEACIPTHIRDGSESPRHTICSLEKKVYKKETPRCTECSEADAKCYCENKCCNALLCDGCLTKHAGHDVVPINTAVDAMAAFVDQSGKSVQDSLDVISYEKVSLEIERKSRVLEFERLQDRIRQWADNLRDKVDSDEQALLADLAERMESTDEKYEKMRACIDEDKIMLAHFEMIHSKFQHCRTATEKLVDMFSFVKANEPALNGGAFVCKNGTGGVHCEHLEFKQNEEVDTVLTAMGGENNLIGAVKIAGPPRLVTSLGCREDVDKHPQKLGGIALLPSERKVAVVDTLNRRIKLISGKEAVISFDADVEEDSTEDALLTVRENSVHDNVNRDIIYDERKNSIIMNRTHSGQIVELTLKGELFRVMKNIRDAVSVCICRSNLLVGREVRGESIEGALDVFDRITWTFLDSKRLPFVPRVLDASPFGSIVATDKTTGVYILTPDLDVMTKVEGRFDGHLMKPMGVCFSNREHIIVADSPNNRILEFTATGKFLRPLLKDVDGLRKPSRLTCDGKGNLFVLDAANIIKVFSHV